MTLISLSFAVDIDRRLKSKTKKIRGPAQVTPPTVEAITKAKNNADMLDEVLHKSYAVKISVDNSEEDLGTGYFQAVNIKSPSDIYSLGIYLNLDSEPKGILKEIMVKEGENYYIHYRLCGNKWIQGHPPRRVSFLSTTVTLGGTVHPITFYFDGCVNEAERNQLTTYLEKNATDQNSKIRELKRIAMDLTTQVHNAKASAISSLKGKPAMEAQISELKKEIVALKSEMEVISKSQIEISQKITAENVKLEEYKKVEKDNSEKHKNLQARKKENDASISTLRSNMNEASSLHNVLQTAANSYKQKFESNENSLLAAAPDSRTNIVAAKKALNALDQATVESELLKITP